MAKPPRAPRRIRKTKKVSLAQQQIQSMKKWYNQVPKAPKRPMFKARTRKVEIISRRAQPRWKMTVPVPKMKKIEGIGGMVSSSWIAALEYKGNWTVMTLLNKYTYNVYIPFRVFEAWYYAHSKGTFFNYRIKGKFKVVRSA